MENKEEECSLQNTATAKTIVPIRIDNKNLFIFDRYIISIFTKEITKAKSLIVIFFINSIYNHASVNVIRKKDIEAYATSYQVA